MLSAVCVRYDHGTLFCWHSDVNDSVVFVQIVSKEIRQGKNSHDVVLASTNTEKANKTRPSAFIREVLDKMKSEIT